MFGYGPIYCHIPSNCIILLAVVNLAKLLYFSTLAYQIHVLYTAELLHQSARSSLSGVIMADSSPTFTAELLDIKPLTLRRWCEYHAEHLSPGTNPPSGQARRFTDKDIEILKHIKHLRSQGFNTATINAQLAGLTFAEVITDERSEGDSVPDSEAIASVASQEGLQSTQALIMVVQDLQRQIDAIQQANQQANRNRLDSVTLLGVGVCIGLLFAVGMILLAWVYGG